MEFSYGENEIGEILERNFPDVKIENLNLIESGWDNLVAVVNGKMAFRFPRNRESELSLKRELLLLARIRDFPFRIPEYFYSSPKIPVFAGYTYIDGVPLNSAKKLSGGLLNDMIRVLDYLSGIDVSHLQETGINVYSPESWMKRQVEVVNSFRESLSEFIEESVFDSLFAQLETTLSGIPETSISLVHGDLYRGNVIISENHHRIRGVIDWQDAFVGDSALDVAALGKDFGLTGTDLLISSLNRIRDTGLAERVRFYQKVEPFYLADFRSRTGKKTEARDLCNTILKRFHR